MPNLTLINDNPSCGSVSGGGDITTKTVNFYDYVGANFSTSTYDGGFVNIPLTIKGAPTIECETFVTETNLQSSAITTTGFYGIAEISDTYGTAEQTKWLGISVYNINEEIGHWTQTLTNEGYVAFAPDTNNYVFTKFVGETSSTTGTVNYKVSSTNTTPTSWSNYNITNWKWSTSATNYYLNFGCMSEVYDGKVYNIGWNGRLYYCKVSDSTGTILDLKPAKKGDSWGFYDRISKNFYTSASLRQFTQDDATATGEGVYGTTITATPNAGYTFVGWYDENDNLLSSSASYEINLESDITVHAKFGGTCMMWRR